jgi:NhaP-type Na+/H+ or K+/H+ antiporter
VTSSPTGFLRDARSIATLAVLLVIVTAFAVAAVSRWVGHLSWAISFVLGRAVGPTDAAAATSVARRLRLPRRLLTLLEGEALFNDATALVLYAAAVTAATSGRFSVCTPQDASSIPRWLVPPLAWPSASSGDGCVTASTIPR